MYACTVGVFRFFFLRGGRRSSAERRAEKKKSTFPARAPQAPHARGIKEEKTKHHWQLLRRPGQRPGELYLFLCRGKQGLFLTNLFPEFVWSIVGGSVESLQVLRTLTTMIMYLTSSLVRICPSVKNLRVGIRPKSVGIQPKWSGFVPIAVWRGLLDDLVH